MSAGDGRPDLVARGPRLRVARHRRRQPGHVGLVPDGAVRGPASVTAGSGSTTATCSWRSTSRPTRSTARSSSGLARRRRRRRCRSTSGPGWPFAGRVVQDSRSRDDSLEVTLSLQARRADAGGARLAPVVQAPPHGRRGTPGRAIRAGRDPSRRRVDVRPRRRRHPDRRAGRAPAGPWDDCFTGLRSTPRLTWPGVLGLEVTVVVRSLVVYDQPRTPSASSPRPRLPTS